MSIEVSLHDFLDYRNEQTLLEGLAAFRMGTVNLSDDEGAERFNGAFLTANAFDLLGARPAVGRGFVAGDDAPGAESVVLLGHALWTHRYAADPGIVGETLRVNGRPATVIGVMPPGFRFPQNEDVWTNLALDVRDPEHDQAAAQPQQEKEGDQRPLCAVELHGCSLGSVASAPWCA